MANANSVDAAQTVLQNPWSIFWKSFFTRTACVFLAPWLTSIAFSGSVACVIALYSKSCIPSKGVVVDVSEGSGEENDVVIVEKNTNDGSNG